MFARSRYVNDVTCPDEATVGCQRPYCPFAHKNPGVLYNGFVASGSGERPAVSGSNSSIAITQQDDNASMFTGYVGYVAGSSQGAQAAAAEPSPVPVADSSQPAQTVTTPAAPAPVASTKPTPPKNTFERKKAVKVEPPDLPTPKPMPVAKESHSQPEAVTDTKAASNKSNGRAEAPSPAVTAAASKQSTSESSAMEKAVARHKAQRSNLEKKSSQAKHVEKPAVKEPKLKREKKAARDREREQRPPDKKNKPETGGSLNERAKKLADLDKQIAELQATIEKQKAERDKITGSGASSSCDAADTYDPSESLKADEPAAAAGSCASPGYKPTPIAQLEANAVINKVSAAYKPKRKVSPDPPEMRKKIPKKSTSKSAKMVDLFSVPSSNKLAAAADSDSDDPVDDEDLPLPAKVSAAAEAKGSSGEQQQQPDDGLSTEEEEKPSTSVVSQPDDLGVGINRRRQAHHSDKPVSVRATAAKGHVPSARQQMSNRYASMQQEKQRILQAAIKKTAAPPDASSQHRVDAVAATVPKGEKRKAHEPKPMSAQAALALERPRIPALSNSKIPREIRQKYLDVFIDELLKKTDDHKQAFKLAEHEERELFTRTHSRGGYQSGAVNVLKRLRAAQSPNTHSALVLSHNDVLYGKALAAGNISVRDRSLVADFDVKQLDDRQLYELLVEYSLTGDQLMANGFPYFDIDGTCTIHTQNAKRKTVISDSELRRVCSRCGAEFRLTEEGEYEKEEECEYHWGKSWKRKVAGSWDNRWSCCQSDISVKGCCFAARHVCDALRASDLQNFVQTQPADHCDNKVYAVDCEMVYTVWGSALARVSVVSRDLTPVLDILIRPEHTLVDCNSRFSGIKAEELDAAQYTFEQARTAFLDLVTDDTLLVGHSLESDLRALRVVHERVIDTSVVGVCLPPAADCITVLTGLQLFPHRLGPPYKRALKTLMAEHLKKIIQEDEYGHDSNEDASAALELVLYKLKEDQKVKHK